MTTLSKEKRRELADARRRKLEHADLARVAPSYGIEERDEFLYTENRTIRRGDLFRVTGGPVHHDRPYGIRGTFRFESAWSQGTRWFVLCHTVDRSAIDTKSGRPSIDSSHVLFVAGPSYPHPQIPNLTMRPYRLHRMLDETARKSGLQGATRSAAAEARR